MSGLLQCVAYIRLPIALAYSNYKGINIMNISVNEFTLILQWRTIEPWLESLIEEGTHNSDNLHNPTT